MLNYLKKLVVEIFPSVAATVIGGYIVNHYIITKPAPPAAAVSIAAPKAPAEAKPAEKPAEISNLPEAGVKAKGISERTLLERTASEKATVTEKPTVTEKAEKPAVAPEPRRDANDLARAAIERLRSKGDASRTASDARTQESSRVAAAPAIRPLPPPIMVSAPLPADAHGTGSQPASADDGGPRRPTPPADVPLARLPLDLHAGSMTESSDKERMTLGEEMLSSMKSVFHAVLPKPLP